MLIVACGDVHSHERLLVKFCFAPVCLKLRSLDVAAWLLLNLQWMAANFKLQRTEHVSGAGGKWGERVLSGERERSGQRAKSAAQSPLTPTLRWFSDWYLTLTYPRSAFYYSISILALTIFQIIIYCTLTLACSLLITYWNMPTKCITDVSQYVKVEQRTNSEIMDVVINEQLRHRTISLL